MGRLFIYEDIVKNIMLVYTCNQGKNFLEGATMIEIKSDMMGYIQNIRSQVMFDSQTTVIDELV